MSEEVRPLAVIDIDGVLADVRHRVHHLERPAPDYRRFFAAAPRDPLLTQGSDVVHRLAEVCEIVYLSGRPEYCRRDTLDWFARHGLPAGELHLRPNRDYRPARLYKVEVLRGLRRRAPVSVVVDDDPDVIAAVTAAGFDVLPATWMGADDAAETLHRAQERDGRT
ncbi:hypothetical protein G7072_09035 [Nocardioides sp. HDW12B]|uniref:phosphatase domain-containing protein n=1 Tax=Nocardioides sp. HDW12B TaxID=2714939 RepID=UPI00140DD2B1|nr:hypothetical protein [Nocardioides sp. HDW12B]QIK66477.1 hypothetical protein G7072_09035 [Nocardioides sp. HDW12B]